ncbi:hypothetical protein [uncultured Bacteroides sp.]|uniref:amino acid kinase family protein n=1 Tax=uncultured Bacteroides sp. TaxID=162156 RepID=UPI002AA88E41|nr:hypothetical protein [uncultured Bacteroides sp.]
MKILKFVGASMGSIKKIRRVVSLSNDATPKVIIISASPETVSYLNRISTYLFNGEIEKSRDAITRLEFNFIDTLNSLLINDEIKKLAVGYILDRFAIIWNLTKSTFTSAEERIILAQGELIAASFIHFCLEDQGVNNALLSSTDFIKLDINMEPDMQDLRTKLRANFLLYKKTSCFVIQGNICINVDGEIDIMDAEQSDSCALLIGTAIDAKEILIWKDIDDTI